ncbi:L-2-hydroxyglutarate oxidase [Pontibacillus litoralis]|uniref:Hydroxyglutarate oxidase n=1 Tax=Pontibacillus litoralis JSM 072002 TaxID=1385512 RepID=A0A0A5GAQ3_9BACI|nr:L-2-hydroxyglutarate oxidase [Pontibacillus litoralis]KGX88195.1 hydroxyglutarate oxidase [Pontibacillus litoralis JSM 072002]
MYDIVIVGGGIVGLSTAYALMEKHPNVRLAVMEKEKEWATHQTGRNSGVIHSGIYYKPGSLKARMAKEGAASMVEFCRQHDIKHDVCGKVLVATEEEELPRMEALFKRANENQIEATKLSKEELLEIEPHVNGLGALKVNATGIVDYKVVTEKLASLVAEAGADLFLNTEVMEIEEMNNKVHVETNQQTFTARFLVNCTGLQSDRMLKRAGIHTDLRIVPFRGEYFTLTEEKKHLVKGLIYPVPNPDFPFLGVHLTRMIDGSVHAGPNAVLSLKREGYNKTSFDMKDAFDVLSYPGFWRMASGNMQEGMKEMFRSFHKKTFVKSLQRLVPDIQEQDVIPAKPGVRAQAMLADGQLVDDFYIIPGKHSIHICNAPSPAATASLEIGKEIVKRIPIEEAVLV